MKAIKLLGILIVLIGAIVLALNWNSLFSKGSDSDEQPTEDQINITDKCKEISDAWAAQKEWNDRWASQLIQVSEALQEKSCCLPKVSTPSPTGCVRRLPTK